MLTFQIEMTNGTRSLNTNRAICNAVGDAESAEMNPRAYPSSEMQAVFLKDYVKVGPLYGLVGLLQAPEGSPRCLESP